jgi:hypothetical protein
MSALRAFFQAYAGPIRTRINEIRYGQWKYNIRAPYIIFPLPIPNFVNSCANRAGIGLKECPKRAHSPFLSAFHSAPFSLLSRLDYCPLCPPRHSLYRYPYLTLSILVRIGRHRLERMPEARSFTISGARFIRLHSRCYLD